GGRSDVSAIADADGCDQNGVTADEGVGADDGAVLVHAIVVAGDGAGADVGALADLGIAQVGEVIGLGAASQLDFLGLHKIADVRLGADLAAWAESRVGAEDGCLPDDGLFGEGAVVDADLIADAGVADDRVAADEAVAADGGFAQQLHEGLDDGVLADGDARVDEHGFGLVDGDAVVHQLPRFALAQNRIQLRQLAAGVDAEHLAGVRGG